MVRLSDSLHPKLFSEAWDQLVQFPPKGSLSHHLSVFNGSAFVANASYGIHLQAYTNVFHHVESLPFFVPSGINTNLIAQEY